MKFMTAEQFKRECMSVIDETYESGEEVTITKDGESVAKLAPFRGDEIFPSTPGRKKRH